jgi:AcrR family transcriptional regulator
MAYRRTPQVQARLDATRARILDAALALVAGGGWRAASVAAVARRAGVATGTVYKHVSGKDELFAEVFRRAAGVELAAVAAATDGEGSPLARLEAGLRVFAERALAGRQLAYALLAEPADPAVEAARLTFRAAYRARFQALLDEAVAAGELPEHDPALVAAVLTGAMGEALIGPLAAVASAPDGAPDGPVDALVAACLRALPHPAPTGPDLT